MASLSTITSIFFPVKSPQKIGAISVDCVISDGFNYESVVTDYPTEEGFYIQDNIYLKPLVYQMRGIISDISLSDVYQNLFTFSNNITNTPSENAFSQLLELRDKRIVFDVVTSLKILKNMVFTKIEPNRDKDTGKSLQFTAEFKQITKVSSQSVVIQQEKTTNKSFPDTKNKGSQNIDETKAVPEAQKSIAASIADSFSHISL